LCFASLTLLFFQFSCTFSIAETQLSEAQKIPGYPLVVLRLVASTDPSNTAVRLSAAIHFKNIVKKGWDISEVSDMCIVYSKINDSANIDLL